jgi:subtilisin family serine protease
MAPKAFLGNYKVFSDTPGAGASNVNIVRAIEDAVNDGMDVINLSLGSVPAAPPANDLMVTAVEEAVRRGVVVVVAAGNGGPGLGSLSTLAAGASGAIAVGASVNPRPTTASVTVNGESFEGRPAALAADRPYQAPMREAGLACEALAAGALEDRIALILRGECTFETKLNNAQKAGAVAAVIYTNDLPVGNWTPGANRLPAILVANADGLRMKALLIHAAEALLTFNLGDPGRLAGFSARGPSVVDLLKPDLVAPGTSFFTAAQRVDNRGELFSLDGYTTTSGTSFAAPLVAGAAALVKSTNPKLTPMQIRSLLIDTASAVPASLIESGTGLLNLDAAVRARAAAVPASVHFGTGGGTVEVARELAITNLSGSAESFALAAEPFGESPAPQLEVSSLALAAGETGRVSLRWSVAGLPPGEHRGWVVVRSSASDVDLRIPYWYGVRDRRPASITVMEGFSATPRAGSNQVLYVRVADSSGSSIPDFEPVVAVERGTGAVRTVRSVDVTYPGVWRIDVRMGIEQGSNVFRVRAGDVTLAHTVVAN